MTETLPKIFIAIASYRDTECQHTVADAFRKAAHPGRVFVGICWQFDENEDADCFAVPPPFPDQVRVISYRPEESKGGCWARAQAMSLMKDEEYVLQIDAHMRFVPGWDELMIDMLHRCPVQPALLSTTPPDYTPPRQLLDTNGEVPTIVVTHVGDERGLAILSLGWWIGKHGRVFDPGPMPSAFICGNFVFGPRRLFEEVPIDPHIYFRGQEPAFSIRAWTHGWHVYQPDALVIYHHWMSESKGGSLYKHKNEMADMARKRLLHLLDIEQSDDPRALIDLDRYGMGSQRSPHDFWKFAGVDLKAGTIADFAKLGLWKHG